MILTPERKQHVGGRNATPKWREIVTDSLVLSTVWLVFVCCFLPQNSARIYLATLFCVVSKLKMVCVGCWPVFIANFICLFFYCCYFLHGHKKWMQMHKFASIFVASLFSSGSG